MLGALFFQSVYEGRYAMNYRIYNTLYLKLSLEYLTVRYLMINTIGPLKRLYKWVGWVKESDDYPAPIGPIPL